MTHQPGDPPDRIVVGVDPGLASVGWGVVRESRGSLVRLDHGCIVTAAGSPTAERLDLIYRGIRGILAAWKPHSGGVESLFFFRNVSSALPVAEARGVIRLAFEHEGVPLDEFTPNDIKKSVTGSARADKVQVQEMVRVLLGLAEVPRPDHAADALAAAICRLHHETPAAAAAALAAPASAAKRKGPPARRGSSAGGR